MRYRWWLLPLVVILIGSGWVAGATPDAVSLLTFTVPTRSAVEALINQGLDVANVRRAGAGFEVDVVAHREDRAAVQAVIYPVRVRIADLLAQARAVAADYRDLADYNNEMADIANTYPSLAKLRKFGTSIEGRPIRGLEITSPVSKKDGRAEAAFMGLHHAREWASGELTMNLAWDLVQKYGTDPQVTALLDRTRIWVVPVVNPDGFVYTRTVYALWRKNRRNNGDGTFGVDNNRNYAYQWGGPGSSPTTSSETYRGTGQFSEPETKAMRDLFLQRHIITSITNHSYGNWILYPWGYTSTDTPEAATYASMGAAMAAYNGYFPGQAYDTLYPAAGITDDWVYGVPAGFCFTFEHGNQFQPPYSQVPPMYAASYPAFLYLAEQARARASLLDGQITDAVTGDGVRATLTLSRSYTVPRWTGGSETETKTTDLRAKGSGRYSWRILPSKMPLEGSDPGYTLAVSASGYVTQNLNVKIGRGEHKTVNVALVPALQLAPAAAGR